MFTNRIITTETVNLTHSYNGNNEVTVKVKMVGVFEIIGETSIDDPKKFGRINGAAIIFPFIREHIANLSIKAGIGPILLPPINFTQNNR